MGVSDQEWFERQERGLNPKTGEPIVRKRKEKRYYSWCFTINNDTYDDLERLVDKTHIFQYMIVGFEEGKGGTPHIQGYVMYYTQKSLSAAKLYLPRAHLEYAKGTPQDNYDYCSKDGSFFEFGELPHQGRATMAKIDAAFENPEKNPHMVMQYKHAYEYIKQHRIKEMKVDTQYYCIYPQIDAISEIREYFNWSDDYDPDMVICPRFSDLAQYDNPRVIVLYEDNWEMHRYYSNWPRGMPISVKHGYAWKVYKPEILIIITEDKKRYPLYKNI